MSEKVHPIGDEIKLSSTPFTNTDFNLVLIELKAIRNEVAALKSSHTAEIYDLKVTQSTAIADLKSSQTAEINSLREILIQQPSSSSQPPSSQSAIQRQLTKHEITVGGMDLANELYENRSNNHKSNFVHVDRIFNENSAFLEPLMTACPHIKIVLSHILTNNFGFSVKNVAYVTPMIDFTEEDCQRIATALAFFLRKRKTAEVALEVSERSARTTIIRLHPQN